MTNMPHKGNFLFLLVALALAACQPYVANNQKTDEVKGAFNEWIEDVNHKDMQKLLFLYDERADLHPTLSGKLRSSPEEIEDYFKHFLALTNLRAEASAPHIQIFNDVATNDGFYIFSFRENGKPKRLKARYSFTYLKEPGGWKIIDHHSSVVPAEAGHPAASK
jgi:hypothetical protein